MTSSIRNPLTIVWAFLTAITLASWWISQGSGASYHTNTAVTLSVLVIAVLKVHLVMRYFMEVRHAPPWLRRTADGWLILLFLLLSGLYLTSAG